MWYKILAWLVLSIISGVFYRMGGSDTFNTKWRDIGCALCATLLLIILNTFVYNIKTILALVVMTGLTFASLTTYFKKKGEDAKWWNWVFVGTAFGLSALPFSYATGHWLGFIIRTVFLGVVVCVWSERVGEVIWEEFGRGVLLVSTIPLLLI